MVAMSRRNYTDRLESPAIKHKNPKTLNEIDADHEKRDRLRAQRDARIQARKAGKN